MSDYTFAAYFWSTVVALGVTGPVLGALVRQAIDGARSFSHCG